MIEFLLNDKPVTDISKRLEYSESFTDKITIRNNSGYLLKNLSMHSTKNIAKFSNVPTSIPSGTESTVEVSLSGKECWDKKQKDVNIEWQYELEY